MTKIPIFAMPGEDKVTPQQLDAIREVVNIGAGHAATALSNMTSLRVMISVPRIRWVTPEDEVPTMDGSGELVVISVPVKGPLGEPDERASLILSRSTAARMVALLLRRPEASGEDAAGLSEIELSTLKELGNIVCASYVGVLGSFLGEGVMIGTPELLIGLSGDQAEQTRRGLAIETDFTIQKANFEGVFVLNHSEVSFRALLDALGLGEAD